MMRIGRTVLPYSVHSDFEFLLYTIVSDLHVSLVVTSKTLDYAETPVDPRICRMCTHSSVITLERITQKGYFSS